MHTHATIIMHTHSTFLSCIHMPHFYHAYTCHITLSITHYFTSAVNRFIQRFLEKVKPHTLACKNKFLFPKWFQTIWNTFSTRQASWYVSRSYCWPIGTHWAHSFTVRHSLIGQILSWVFSQKCGPGQYKMSSLPRQVHRVENKMAHVWEWNARKYV